MTEILDEIKTVNTQNTNAKLSLLFVLLAIAIIIFMSYIIDPNPSIAPRYSEQSLFFNVVRFSILPLLILGNIFSALSIVKKETWLFWKTFTIVLNFLFLTLIIMAIAVRYNTI